MFKLITATLLVASFGQILLHAAQADRLDWYCHMPDRFKDVFTSPAAPRRGRATAATARRTSSWRASSWPPSSSWSAAAPTTLVAAAAAAAYLCWAGPSCRLAA